MTGALSQTYAGSVGGYSFDVVAAPTVTAGAYSAGDIVGGVIELAIGRGGSGKVTLQSIQIVCKADVAPVFTAHLLSAQPATPTNYEDNDAFALAVADCLKWRGSITGFTAIDHGTPHSFEVGGLARILTTDSSGKIYLVLVDATGVTLTSTSDIQVRVTGYQD